MPRSHHHSELHPPSWLKTTLRNDNPGPAGSFSWLPITGRLGLSQNARRICIKDKKKDDRNEYAVQIETRHPGRTEKRK